jgi:DNA polymerase-1
MLVDTSGFIYRAYFANAKLVSDVTGEPCGAVAGFAEMIHYLLTHRVRDFGPTHLVFVLDGGSDRRKAIYPAYKANRGPIDPDLKCQMEPCYNLVRELSLPFLKVAGEEADDIIATLANGAMMLGGCADIISSDKDFMQLLDERITIYDPMPAKQREITRLDCMEKFGVEPWRVEHAQALIGDTADNIPGVAGIGPKGAADIIAHFGSVLTAIENANQISNAKMRAKMMAPGAAENARLSLELATLFRYIEFDEPLPPYREPSFSAAGEWLRSIGLRSVGERYAGT